jgi:hypothetical protein
MDQANRRAAVVVAVMLALLAAWSAWPAERADAADTKYAEARAALTGRDQVAEARRHLGTPYHSSDCNAFRRESATCLNKLVYRKFGWDLPLNLSKQYRYGRAVERANLRPGDLVYFDVGGTRVPDYVAIYSRDGYVIHTDSYWGKTRESEMRHLFYRFGNDSFRGGKRLAPR